MSAFGWWATAGKCWQAYAGLSVGRCHESVLGQTYSGLVSATPVLGQHDFIKPVVGYVGIISQLVYKAQ
jgi:hypothetical protein